MFIYSVPELKNLKTENLKVKNTLTINVEKTPKGMFSSEKRKWRI